LLLTPPRHHQRHDGEQSQPCQHNGASAGEVVEVRDPEADDDGEKGEENRDNGGGFKTVSQALGGEHGDDHEGAHQQYPHHPDGNGNEQGGQEHLE